jgi:hypothetical protein
MGLAVLASDTLGSAAVVFVVAEEFGEHCPHLCE